MFEVLNVFLILMKLRVLFKYFIVEIVILIVFL